MAFATFAGTSMAFGAPPSAPAALQGLEKKGVTVVAPLPAPGGLSAWAAYAGENPVSLYVTPDGKHVIAGQMFDADGANVSDAMVEKAVRQPMNDRAWGGLESSSWVADGSAKAPRTVYVFTDPNCPYCNKFWADARPWVDSQKVQLRHVLVGILAPSSPAKAAALLMDKNAAAVMAAYERGQAAANSKAFATGHVQLLSDQGLKPVTNIPADIQKRLDANAKLMAELGLRGTPGVVWKDAKGAIQRRAGVPEDAMAEILGPK
jgi:thiol:disulfide interchange protein DsbG